MATGLVEESRHLVLPLGSFGIPILVLSIAITEGDRHVMFDVYPGCHVDVGNPKGNLSRFPTLPFVSNSSKVNTSVSVFSCFFKLNLGKLYIPDPHTRNELCSATRF